MPEIALFFGIRVMMTIIHHISTLSIMEIRR